MVIHHSDVNTAGNGIFRTPAVCPCTEPWRHAQYVSRRLCTGSGKYRSALYTTCKIWNDPHGNSPLSVKHSVVNGIFVHTLYGPVQLVGFGPCVSAAGCVHILGSPVDPCTLCVQLMEMYPHGNAPLRGNTLLPTEFSYTHCMDLYISMAVVTYVFHSLCMHYGKSRSVLYTRYTIQNDTHGNPPLSGEHSAVNGIFVHPPYGP